MLRHWNDIFRGTDSALIIHCHLNKQELQPELAVLPMTFQHIQLTSGTMSWSTPLPAMRVCSLALTRWNVPINNGTTSSTTFNSCLPKAKCFLWSVRRQVQENRLLLLLEGHLLLALAKLCHQPTARKSWPSSSHRLVWLGSRLWKTPQKKMDLSNTGYMQALREEKLCGLECLLREKELKGFIVSRASHKQATAK